MSSDSLLELSNSSLSRSILNMAECSQRKLVTALSQHVTYGKIDSTFVTCGKLDSMVTYGKTDSTHRTHG